VSTLISAIHREQVHAAINNTYFYNNNNKDFYNNNKDFYYNDKDFL